MPKISLPKLLKQVLILLLLQFSGFHNLVAQFNYTLVTSQEPYNEISNGISLNGSTIWDEETYLVPMGFNFLIEGTSINKLAFIGTTLVGIDTNSPFTGFSFTNADLYDRGNIQGFSSLSPIRYINNWDSR